MSVVALVRCEGYDYEKVKEAINKGIALLGGIEQFISGGERILLKPNLLAPDSPDKCVTTHPTVFRAVAEIAQKAGAYLSYGDSPAGLFKMSTVARKAGLMEVGEELGIAAVDFSQGKQVSFSEGLQNKSFVIAAGVLECDGLVSLPKFKTHGLTTFTGAIKNQFGCVPGLLKGEFHAKLPQPERFAGMLADLNLFLRPRLYIMDGIVALEGNGPRRGRPRAMNVILLSTDPVALDATACRMIGLDPAEIAMIWVAQQHGLGSFNPEAVEIVGDSFNSFYCPDFNVAKPGLMAAIKSPRLRNWLVPRPVIMEGSCVCCGICVEACPVQPQALSWRGKEKENPPRYHYDHCIRCYCCQELCPEGAIEIFTPPLGRFLQRG